MEFCPNKIHFFCLFLPIFFVFLIAISLEDFWDDKSIYFLRGHVICQYTKFPSIIYNNYHIQSNIHGINYISVGKSVHPGMIPFSENLNKCDAVVAEIETNQFTIPEEGKNVLFPVS